MRAKLNFSTMFSSFVADDPDWRAFQKQVESYSSRTSAEASASLATVACDRCDSSVATVYCPQDQAHFCPSCDEEHHASSKLLVKHTRLPVYHSPYQFGYCETHQSNRLAYMCEDCGVLLCDVCMSAGSHANSRHSLVSTIEAFTRSSSGQPPTFVASTKSVIISEIQRMHKELQSIKANSEEIQESLDRQLRNVTATVSSIGTSKTNYLRARKRAALLQLLFVEWAEAFIVHMRLSLPAAAWMKYASDLISDAGADWFLHRGGADTRGIVTDIPVWVKTRLSVTGNLTVESAALRSLAAPYESETLTWQPPADSLFAGEKADGLVIAASLRAGDSSVRGSANGSALTTTAPVASTDFHEGSFVAMTSAAVDEAVAYLNPQYVQAKGSTNRSRVAISGFQGAASSYPTGQSQFGVGPGSVTGDPLFSGNFSDPVPAGSLSVNPKSSYQRSVPVGSNSSATIATISISIPELTLKLQEILIGGPEPFDNALSLINSSAVSDRAFLIRACIGVIGTPPDVELLLKRLISRGIESAATTAHAVSAACLASSIVSVVGNSESIPEISRFLSRSDITTDDQALAAVRIFCVQGGWKVCSETKWVLRTAAEISASKFGSAAAGWTVAAGLFAARIVSPALVRASAGEVPTHISLISKQLQRVAHADARDEGLVECVQALRGWVKDQCDGNDRIGVTFVESFITFNGKRADSALKDYVDRHGGVV